MAFKNELKRYRLTTNKKVDLKYNMAFCEKYQWDSLLKCFVERYRQVICWTTIFNDFYSEAQKCSVKF